MHVNKNEKEQCVTNFLKNQQISSNGFPKKFILPAALLH